MTITPTFPHDGCTVDIVVGQCTHCDLSDGADLCVVCMNKYRIKRFERMWTKRTHRMHAETRVRVSRPLKSVRVIVYRCPHLSICAYVGIWAFERQRVPIGWSDSRADVAPRIRLPSSRLVDALLLLLLLLWLLIHAYNLRALLKASASRAYLNYTCISRMYVWVYIYTHTSDVATHTHTLTQATRICVRCICN